MMNTIVWVLTVCGCGALFFLIGVYASRRRKPMWFWAGSRVPEMLICNVSAYNQANGRMWKQYSIPFWISGLTYIRFPAFAAGLLIAASTLGIGWLIWTYHRIVTRYSIKRR